MSAPSSDIPCQRTGFEPVRGAAQELENTASRRTGPRRWIRSVQWLIAAGLHPRANATTLRVAHDMAARMDYDTGHARYCLDEMVARLGIDRSTIKRHIAALRELGALAWVVHGTKTNVRRALGMKGYAGTATVYAAVIPAAYDRAMGHRIIGTGYTARAVVDQRSQHQDPVDNPPVDNDGLEACAPPSLTWVEEEGKLKVEGGSNYTPRSAGRRTASIPHQKTSSSSKTSGTAERRSPLQVARDIRIARRVRPLVNWTQAEGLRRLAYALRPLIDRGLDADQIAAELSGMCMGWKPKQPANYLRTALARDAAQEAELAAAEERLADQTWREQAERAAADRASLEVLFGRTVRTDDDRREARARARYDIQVVIDHLEDHGDDDAIDLYGTTLASKAAGLAASPTFQAGAFA